MCAGTEGNGPNLGPHLAHEVPHLLAELDDLALGVDVDRRGGLQLRDARNPRRVVRDCDASASQQASKHLEQSERTLDNMVAVERSRKRRRDVLRQLGEERADLLERARGLLAQLGRGDLLCERDDGRRLERVLGRAHLGAVGRDVGRELRVGSGSASEREWEVGRHTFALALAMAELL